MVVPTTITPVDTAMLDLEKTSRKRLNMDGIASVAADAKDADPKGGLLLLTDGTVAKEPEGDSPSSGTSRKRAKRDGED